MPTFEFLGLMAALAALWLWFDSVAAREVAVRASRRACEADGFLFLDDTVAIRSIRPARDEDGRVRLSRVYGFEYSDTGNNRRAGWVALRGRRVVALHLEPQLTVQ